MTALWPLWLFIVRLNVGQSLQQTDCTLEEFVNSNFYDANFDISSLGNSYRNGQQATVSCTEGYGGFFQLICARGKWQARGSKCRPQHCPLIYVDSDVLVNGSTEVSIYGSVLQFSCKSNSQVLLGPENLYCGENGQWSDDAPKCEAAIICSAPNIENGYVPQAQDKYKENDILHFECNAKFKRAEERSSKCVKIGTKAEWSPTPMCERIKCRLELPALAGTVYDPPFKNVFLPDEEVRVTCASKYDSSKPHFESLTSTCQDNGEWTVRPICEEVTCGNRKVWPVTSWDVKWWERVTLGYTTRYRCAGGYRKTGDMATCSRNGWSPSPLCEEITCPRHIDENAVCDGETQDEFRYDAQVNCDCKEGFSGRYTLTCRERGWIGYQACREITCPRHIDEDAVCDGETQDEFKHNDQINCNCKEGFRGRYTVTCGDQGWTGYRACTRITCPVGNVRYAVRNAVSLDPKYRYYYNDTVKFACTEGYRGSPYRVCTETGWIGDSQCTDCTLEEFVNSNFYDANFDISSLGNSYRNGQQATVSCTEGYGGFFQLICARGKWQARGSKCRPQHCPLIYVDSDVQVNGSTEESIYGSVLQFSCKSNSQVLLGPENIYCGENGEWSDNAPTCEAIICSAPTIENGFVPQAQDQYKENDILHFGCNAKFKRAEERSSKCIKIGTKAEWSPTPMCERIKCRLELPALAGTVYDPPFKNVFLPDEEVRVTCASKYYISKPQFESLTSTCQDNGEWTVRPICEEVTCSNRKVWPVSYWDVRWRERVTLGHTARYRCAGGYRMTGDMATCSRNGWSPSPLCEELKCLRHIDENAVCDRDREDEFRYGARVTCDCKEGFRGRYTLTCRERGWTGYQACEGEGVEKM
ncbi:uncharacterized protein V6R79_011246 [Siganus canaliculatus]